MNNLNYEYAKVKELLRNVKEVLDRALAQSYELYVFGSFARGDACPNSDLDIALKTDKEVGGKVIAKIKHEIESLEP